MSVAASSTLSEAAAKANTVHAWRCAAALGLGAPENVAQRFGETGLAEFSGKPLSLQPLQGEPSGPWIGATRAQRPAGMSEDEWVKTAKTLKATVITERLQLFLLQSRNIAG